MTEQRAANSPFVSAEPFDRLPIGRPMGAEIFRFLCARKSSSNRGGAPLLTHAPHRAWPNLLRLGLSPLPVPRNHIPHDLVHSLAVRLDPR
jgi:hypothetical protein